MRIDYLLITAAIMSPQSVWPCGYGTAFSYDGHEVALIILAMQLWHCFRQFDYAAVENAATKSLQLIQPCSIFSLIS